MASPGKLKNSADITRTDPVFIISAKFFNDSGMQTFPVPVEFGARKRADVATLSGS